ncbi:MAG: helix-turn-helix domain-containing protein [Bacteroidetes bacterium]|nr:helix-turn-helix domain-containing protein [Bacteroidota bacterium]
MKKEENTPYKFNSISDFHRVLGLPKPLHPLISLVNNCDLKIGEGEFPKSLMLNFYKISFLENRQGKVKYGQSYYDFDEGGMVFISPNQLLFAPDNEEVYQGVNIFIHPDFLRNYPLANIITKYGFFNYSTNEALHLSDKEKSTILAVFKIIEDELQNPIDNFSQDVVISQLELLLNYSNRFYNRQFITRKATNNDLLLQLEEILNDYFNNEKSVTQGVPTVQFLSDNLNVSASYLSDMLRSLIGQNAQQHIHEKLIEKAKEKLTTTKLTVSEIAYELGFEHSQSFSKLFKKKTNMTPIEFKQSFN